ncbi:MAG: membrane integrity-associated transporter subunit PqiC [Betaproteobacteria bacterium]|nr:membrane integrity-associated transporter subunit PqiC [Betaproteobacteria bacterium]
MMELPMRVKNAVSGMGCRSLRWLAAICALALLGGCASVLPPPPPAENVYLLEAVAPLATANISPRRDFVIEVGMPRVRPGFDTAQMVWVRKEHGLEVYARNRWVDTPAHMLAPLLAQALQHSGAFKAVVQSPSPVAARLRLETEIVRLQQDFTVQPSRVQFTLSARLVDLGTRQVLASTEFDETKAATSEDAYGGVKAANQALERLLVKLTEFCVTHAPTP